MWAVGGPYLRNRLEPAPDRANKRLLSIAEKSYDRQLEVALTTKFMKLWLAPHTVSPVPLP